MIKWRGFSALESIPVFSFMGRKHPDVVILNQTIQFRLLGNIGFKWEITAHMGHIAKQKFSKHWPWVVQVFQRIGLAG
jgi:hypothetical protein